MVPSPYALLCASKPKPPQTVTTEYDLYSLSLPAAADSLPLQEPAVTMSMPTQSASPAAKRTHYIADIQARHTSAMRQASQTSRPL